MSQFIPTDDPLPLSEAEQDGITELLNLSMGKAARDLEAMVGEAVGLSVPSVSFLSLGDARSMVDEETSKKACAIRQSFAGGLDGEAFLVFPEDGAFRLLAHILGEETPKDELGPDEVDAFKEIGNVVLNGCLVTLVDALKTDGVDCTLPHVLRGEGRAVLMGELAIGSEHSIILFKRVRFTLESMNLIGYVLLGLGLQSAKLFKDTVSRRLSSAE